MIEFKEKNFKFNFRRLRHLFSSGLIFSILFLTNFALADSELDGKLIRKIEMGVDPIFMNDADGLIYDLANDLKAGTKISTIKKELLFKEGDVYDQFRVDETMRNLRALAFLREIRLKTVVEGDYVDLYFQVQDVWTLYPILGFSSGGGTKNSEIGIQEGNLFGYGKRLEMRSVERDSRQNYEAVYDDIRFQDGAHRLIAAAFLPEDQSRFNLSFGRPFRNFTDEFSWQTEVESADLINFQYKEGDEDYLYRIKRENLLSAYRIATGTPEKGVTRYSIGYGYSKADFEQADENDYLVADLDPNEVGNSLDRLAADRTFSGPFLGVSHVVPDFISLPYVDRFDRVEDFNLGSFIEGQVQAAPTSFGSSENALLGSFSVGDGARLGEREFIRGLIGFRLRNDESGFQNKTVSFDTRYYNVLGSKELLGMPLGYHTLASSVTFDYSEELDKDRQYNLGASDGLRGYEDFAFNGNKRVLMNFEDRFVISENIFKLVSLGGAFFADVGTASESPFFAMFRSSLQSNVGFGFRFGIPRSSGGTVVRLDIAFPTRTYDDEKAWKPRFLITTGMAFSGKLRSELSGIENTNFRFGFGR